MLVLALLASGRVVVEMWQIQGLVCGVDEATESPKRVVHLVVPTVRRV